MAPETTLSDEEFFKKCDFFDLEIKPWAEFFNPQTASKFQQEASQMRVSSSDSPLLSSGIKSVGSILNELGQQHGTPAEHSWVELKTTPKTYKHTVKFCGYEESHCDTSKKLAKKGAIAKLVSKFPNQYIRH